MGRLNELQQAAALRRLFGLPLLWLRRRWHRRELAKLDETQLKDVGLDLEFVRREIEKFFWQE
jgi:uncharacterized protein YjiS (DUF1127 family)